MKRELKARAFQGAKKGYSSFRRCPDEEGTESTAAAVGNWRAAVVSEGVPMKRELKAPWPPPWPPPPSVSEGVPMKRELKGLAAKPRVCLIFVFQKVSR